MKQPFLLTAMALLSGCASVSPLRYPPVQVISPHPSLNAAYADAQALQLAYLDKADAVGLETLALDGLAIGATLATIGLVAFSSSTDAKAATALTGAAVSGVRPILGMNANQNLLLNASNALNCIMIRAAELRLGTDPRAYADAATIYVDRNFMMTNPLTARSVADTLTDIEAIDLVLAAALSSATSAPEKDPRLEKAIAAGATARTKIAIGLKARRDASARVNGAISDVKKAVKFKQADIGKLLEALAKVEVPKPPETPPASPGTTQQMSLMGPAAQQAARDDLSAIIELLAVRIEQIAPEREAEVLNRVDACLGEFVT